MDRIQEFRSMIPLSAYSGIRIPIDVLPDGVVKSKSVSRIAADAFRYVTILFHRKNNKNIPGFLAVLV
jgi:hypothetical protein